MDDENLADLSAAIPTLEREDLILRFLWEEGYSSTSCIHKEVLPKLSIQNVRRILKNLAEYHIIEYKELPLIHKQGSGERVYHLKTDGLQILEKSSTEISRYEAGVQKIRSTCLRHFLEVRNFERPLLRAINQSEYCATSLNEFFDSGKLYFQIKQTESTVNLRSDALITIKRQGYERLTIRLELDRGTEGFGQIFKKLDTYVLYNQSSLVCAHSQTFPVLVLFVANTVRVKNLAAKVQGHPAAKFLWFLSVDSLGKRDLWVDPVVFNCQQEATSLLALATDREPILTFQNAVTEAGDLEPIFHYAINTRFGTASDPFFPVKVDRDGKDFLWMPDGYMRIYRKIPDQEEKELLFAILVSIQDESGDRIIEKFLPCETFLTQDTQRKRVSETNHYGCFVIVKSADKIREVQNVLQNLKIGARSRMILVEDCVTEKIFHEPVWITGSEEKICLLPGGNR